MSFLFNAGGIGSHEIKSEKPVNSFVLINLDVFFLLNFCSLRVKALAKVQSSVQIMLNFSTINEKGKCYSRLFCKRSFKHVVNSISDEIFTVLDEEYRCVSIFIENKIELKLRYGIMKHIRRNKRGLWSILLLSFWQDNTYKKDENWS